MFVIKRDGTGERSLGDGRWPDWSPDGQQIVFANGGDVSSGAWVNSQLYVTQLSDVAGTDRSRHIGEGDCPAWSPDGKSIACCVRTAESEATIQIIVLDSGERTILGPGWLRPNWDGESRSVVVNGGAPRQRNVITRYRIDGVGEPVPLFRDIVGSYEPCISANGDALVFSVLR